MSRHKTISGQVTDAKEKPVENASVFFARARPPEEQDPLTRLCGTFGRAALPPGEFVEWSEQPAGVTIFVRPERQH